MAMPRRIPLGAFWGFVEPPQRSSSYAAAEIYLGSVSTFNPVLEENQQVKERRALARHPARAIPELVATAPARCFHGTSPSSPAR
ncbi:hypothetical protein NicSoilB8_40210 [Arthrobacter sp. NicSoilB8]|nr:hypothetical protein NicSoilB8_40210 [Arthrobacter sp. NicSoilB8]